MLKLISIFSFFFKELVFESKDEYNFNSPKFSIKRVLLWVVLVSMLFLTITFSNRAISLAKMNIELTSKNAKLQAELEVKNKEVCPSNSQSPVLKATK